MRNAALSLCLLVALGAGCAYNPQTVHLAPAALIAPSDRGQGVSVSVKVTDERPSQSLGNRGDAYGKAAEIRSSDDIASVVSGELKRALVAKGFKVVATGAEESASLAVEVRLLEYSTSTGFFTGGIHLRSALKAQARRGSENYDKLYRSDREERVVVVPTAETNAEWINRSLSEVIQQLFSDDALLNFLAGKK